MSKTVTIRLPEDLYEKLQQHAAKEFTSAGAIIRKAVNTYIDVVDGKPVEVNKLHFRNK